ncbi:hypothetical protein [Sphingobacterium sp. BIGb0165]|uniref:hypothetical protein n=1 Tax=Sphingobacterium sp. BIGb0165 TaxID=2940615 RepID=UPI00216891D2|nr:hypothetical protein [Sphingobacterium sp. BIGb0165]MCS4229068.1 hypothetical protein [Sphingobacterium sp. BIGb0165]
MNRKIVKLLTLMLFACCMGKSLSAQQFYPMHFIQLFTDEGVRENEIVRLNENYLLPTGFEHVNDTLYLHPQNKERVVLSARRMGDKNELLLTYLTASDLKVFRERLEGEGAGFERVDDNTYQLPFKNPVNKFMIGKDTVIDNKRFHTIKYLLIYDRGQRFPFSADHCTFPATETYPLQHTTWYFTANYERAQSNSEYNDISVIFSKEKTKGSNKIEFVDDINFKITYIDQKKKAHVYRGTYQNYKSDIFFRYDGGEWSDRDRTGRALHVPDERDMGTESFFYDPKSFAQAEGTLRYFRFIFSKSYKSSYNTDLGIMELSGREIKEQGDRGSMPKREN